MKSGTCPKCGSREVYAGTEVPFKAGGYGSNTIPISSIFGPQAALDNYICCSCGAVESYVSDKGKLATIRAKWPKVRR